MIILLNCSLKGKTGNSRYFLDRLKSCNPGECVDIEIRDVLKDVPAFAGTLKQAAALVLGVPLYVDGLPAQVLRIMETLYAAQRDQFPGLTVYAVSNLGLYESAQIHVLLDMVKNWCAKMGMTYGGGLAIGAGGLMSAFKDLSLTALPNKALGRGMNRLAEAIRAKQPMDNLYVQPTAIPRRVYMLAAHTLFRRTGKKNGVNV